MFFVKRKTAYELRISDWSSDVCSSDLQEGARVVAGGERHGDKGYFVKPTVYADTNRDMRLVKEEIFGPVIAAEPYDDDDLDRIAAIANDTDYGLAASVWSRDISKALKLASKIKAGTVWVNRSEEHTSELQSLMRIS